MSGWAGPSLALPLPTRLVTWTSSKGNPVVRWCAVVRGGLAAALVCALAGATPAFASRSGDHPKLDQVLNDLASNQGKGNSNGKTQVIVLLKFGWSAATETKKLGGRLGRS